MSAISVQKISCDNDAFIIADFTVNYIDDNGDTQNYGDSGNFPIDNANTIDLGSAGIDPGTFIWPKVHAVAGDTVEAPKKVKYAPNGLVAVYRLHGTTFDFQVDLIQ